MGCCTSWRNGVPEGRDHAAGCRRVHDEACQDRRHRAPGPGPRDQAGRCTIPAVQPAVLESGPASTQTRNPARMSFPTGAMGPAATAESVSGGGSTRSIEVPARGDTSCQPPVPSLRLTTTPLVPSEPRATTIVSSFAPTASQGSASNCWAPPAFSSWTPCPQAMTSLPLTASEPTGMPSSSGTGPRCPPGRPTGRRPAR